MRKLLVGLFCITAFPAFAQQINPNAVNGGITVGPPKLSSGQPYVFRLDSAGSLITTTVSGIPTYSASANFSNSSAGDAFCINGSASKTVYVKEVRVTATASAQVVSNISLVRRSTADSAGTAMTAVASQSSDPAATAAAQYFTTAPTPGTTVGDIRDRFLTISGSTIVTVSEGLFNFDHPGDKPQVLVGTAQGLCLEVPSTAGGSWSVSTEWTEQ